MKPKTILDKIVTFKKVEIDKRKNFTPLKSFINKIPKERRDFKSALKELHHSIKSWVSFIIYNPLLTLSSVYL